jgi:predicted ribosomally synthesized peptide with SipW-like signal peptide
MIAPQKKGGTKKMDINRKVLASVFVISMLAFGLGYGTYSYFNDTEKSIGNTFTAGTLDVKIDNEDDGGTVFAFNLLNMEPGDYGEHTFVIYNDGTLPGTLTISVGPYTEDAGLYPEPEAKLQEDEIADLDDQLYILMWQDTYDEGGVDLDGDGVIEYPGDNIYDATEDILCDGMVSDELSQDEAVVFDMGRLESKDTIYVGLYYLFQDDYPEVNNLAMGDSVVFDIEFALDQVP